MIQLFFKLLIGHAIMDFWAQSDAVAKMKNRHNETAEFCPLGQKPQKMWPYALTAHALMHGAAVWFITGSFALFLVETTTHWLIDFYKCDNRYGIHVDQGLHIGIKVLYVGLITLGLA